MSYIKIKHHFTYPHFHGFNHIWFLLSILLINFSSNARCENINSQSSTLSILTSDACNSVIDKISLYATWNFSDLGDASKTIREEINGTLGTHFDTWGDVMKTSVGIELTKEKVLHPNIDIMIFGQYSEGEISGSQLASTPYGDAQASFKNTMQTYVIGEITWWNYNRGARINPKLGLGAYYIHFDSGFDLNVSNILFSQEVKSHFNNGGIGGVAMCGLEIRPLKKTNFTVQINGGYEFGNVSQTLTVHDSTQGDYPRKIDLDYSGPKFAVEATWKF